jgi:hypothetical protein
VDDLAVAGFDVDHPVWDVVPWLDLVRDVPPDATWPRFMSAPHPRAVGSYGPEFEVWLREEHGAELRWWQRLMVLRVLEHDAAGRLVWVWVLLTLARQLGKSVLLRFLATWRMHQGGRFGEPQLVLHTGSTVPVCREAQRPARLWAKQRRREYAVRETNAQEEIELLSDGSRWLLRGKDSVYGYSAGMGIVDEAWNVRAYVVEDGLEPTMAERVDPQLWLVSTANRRATSLMLARRREALGMLARPDDLFLIEWSARRDVDESDRLAWRAASPHWTDQREKLIGAKLRGALAGQSDDPSEPDPMEAFRAQWLNIWPSQHMSHSTAIDPVKWGEGLDAAGLESVGSASALCVEVSPDLLHASVAQAWRLADGRVAVELAGEWSGDECVNELRAGLPGLAAEQGARVLGWFPTGPAAAIAADMREVPGVDVAPIRSEVTAVCMGFAEHVVAGRVAHGGQLVLTAQVQQAEKLYSGDAWRFTRRGLGHVDAVYAAAGAVHLARTLPPVRRRPRIVVGSGG